MNEPIPTINVQSAPPPPSDPQPPPGYGQPPPGYVQVYGNMPPAVSSYGHFGINPYVTPGLEYKGFNGCCCGTVSCGAMVAASVELVCCILSIPEGAFTLSRLVQKDLPNTFLILYIIGIVANILNIGFSIGILVTRNLSGWAGLWAPVGWITVIATRFVLVISLFVVASVYLPMIEGNPTLRAALYVLVIISIVLAVIFFIPYIWFIVIMSGYICYKKKTGKGSAAVAVATISDPTSI